MCYYIHILWISHQHFSIVSRTLNRIIQWSLLKYAKIGIKSICMNVDNIWIALKLKPCNLHWNFGNYFEVIFVPPTIIENKKIILFKCLNNLKTMVSSIINLLARSLKFLKLELHQISTLFFLFEIFVVFEIIKNKASQITQCSFAKTH